jgi:Immunoglobulin-like domain of bacterial spore germination.
VQASAGAPGRGRFRKTISFSTTAQSGTLIVYSQSMEDGSRQNEVRIPVGFSSD